VRYLPEHNARFAVAPKEAASAWRPVRQGLDLDRVCSFHYTSTVLNDNTVRIGGEVIDIPPGPGNRSYAQAKVEVRQLLDGSWRVYLGERLIATAAASVIGELRAIRRTKREKGRGRAVTTGMCWQPTA
jgi:hypothetical protein